MFMFLGFRTQHITFDPWPPGRGARAAWRGWARPSSSVAGRLPTPGRWRSDGLDPSPGTSSQSSRDQPEVAAEDRGHLCVETGQSLPALPAS